jgi:hypothetical protein
MLRRWNPDAGYNDGSYFFFLPSSITAFGIVILIPAEEM